MERFGGVFSTVQAGYVGMTAALLFIFTFALARWFNRTLWWIQYEKLILMYKDLIPVVQSTAFLPKQDYDMIHQMNKIDHTKSYAEA